MSFASYKSPFDEALSKPLISDNDTPSVTTTAGSSSTSTNQSTRGSGKKGSSKSSGSLQNNSNKNSNGSRPFDATAVYSKKLSVNTARTTTTTTTTESFSNFDIDQGSPSESNQRQNNDYHPPNLTFETESPQTNSLEAALLRERNEESRSILQKMNTISAISSELNSLVLGQQDMVDDVEENAYGVHDATERGVNELERASRLLQRNNGSGVEVFWKFFFGVIGIGGLIVAFIIFLHSM
mmetsp:Transcript_19639/g.24773  ORF Transcript_19639/g.24773 Transcript_19639/m.24773 type:complete len:240 (+) Transcript_19639:196-915(+)